MVKVCLLLLCFLLSITHASSSSSIWVVELKKIDPHVFALEHDLTLLHAHPTLSNFFVFKNTKHANSLLQTRLNTNQHVLWAQPQVERKQHKRYGDPKYTDQWHLHDVSNSGYGYSVRANEAWSMGYTGRGVVISIVDDGVQIRHPDLQNNVDVSKCWDFNGNKADPTPYTVDGHGTSAAGVAAAVRNNGHCGSGAAPEATLVGERLIAEPCSDYTESLALSHHYNQVDIYSCSWGPQDSGADMVEPGRLLNSVLEQGVARGRGGKGNIFVWAGGNGKANDDNCNYDGYANSRFTLAIGALDYTGHQSWYSEPCAALIGVTSSSGSGKGITTTDLTGSAGYSNGECTNTFGGTSSACPLAAGVIALVLQARPELTWRDVQHVIAKNARQVDSGYIYNGDWNTNARGYHHSHRYGFGLLVAPDLITGAKQHVLVPAQKTHSQEVRARHDIPSNGSVLRIPIQIHGSGISFVEHVTVEIKLSHARRGEVGIRLVSPEQTTSVLAEKRSDTHSNVDWTFFTIRHFGEAQADGTWYLELQDWVPNNRFAGTLTYAKINLYGY